MKKLLHKLKHKLGLACTEPVSWREPNAMCVGYRCPTCHETQLDYKVEDLSVIKNSGVVNVKGSLAVKKDVSKPSYSLKKVAKKKAAKKVK